MELASDVRQYQPFLLTARNLYAQVALKLMPKIGTRSHWNNR